MLSGPNCLVSMILEVHGDIKAVRGLLITHLLLAKLFDMQANVLVSADGTAKLADFGNTILAEYTLLFTQTTRKSSISLRWTVSALSSTGASEGLWDLDKAPELISAEATGVSQESDVYALGMVCMRCFLLLRSR